MEKYYSTSYIIKTSILVYFEDDNDPPPGGSGGGGGGSSGGGGPTGQVPCNPTPEIIMVYYLAQEEILVAGCLF